MRASAEASELGKQCFFQQDNYPKYTTHLVREWILYKVTKHLPSRQMLTSFNKCGMSQSGELENIMSQAKETKKDALTKEWTEVIPPITEVLVLSMLNDTKGP